MPEFDETTLKGALTRAGRIAFMEMRERHKGERFYCMGLFTTGSFGYLLPTAMTEEGLESVARSYLTKRMYAGESIATMRQMLRWSTADSPLYLEGKEHFGEVDVILDGISKQLDLIDTKSGWDEFKKFTGGVDAAICNVLRTLDGEGAFGSGIERDRVFVTVLTADQDDSILQLGRRLNPPASVARFEKEWQEWDLFWKSRFGG